MYIRECNMHGNIFGLRDSFDEKELYVILNNLKDSYKKVIILRKLHGFSVKETSELLNWTESKVKVILSRAMQY